MDKELQTTSNEAATGDDELPENFFEDFENNEFLDELVENVAFNDEENESEEETSNRRSRTSSPIVNRCLEEIDKLTRDIRRRKRRLQQELSANDAATSRTTSEIETPTSTTEIVKHERKSRRPMPRRSRSPRRRSKESRNTISNRQKWPDVRRTINVTPPSRVRRRSRSRSRSRRDRSRERSRERGPRRSRSGSPPRKTHRRGVSPPKTQISFLEELERTFAKQGKTFPEKDLLLRIKNKKTLVHPPDYQPPDIAAPQFFTDPVSFQPSSDLISGQHSGFPYGRQLMGNALLPTPGYQQEMHPVNRVYIPELMVLCYNF